MSENKIINEIKEWLYAIVVAVAVATFIHIFLVQPTRVSGQSMDNTLHNGEYLVISKWSHVMREMPNYGEIVIIDSRVQRERSWRDDLTEPMLNYVAFFDKSVAGKNVWVKRVIGREGDSLEFKDGYVYRNGEKLNEPYVPEPMTYTRPGKVEIPKGHVFVMGDNRNHSTDSRYIGPVPVEHVLGRVIFSFL